VPSCEQYSSSNAGALRGMLLTIRIRQIPHNATDCRIEWQIIDYRGSLNDLGRAFRA
jgi:hypothetical protein